MLSGKMVQWYGSGSRRSVRRGSGNSLGREVWEVLAEDEGRVFGLAAGTDMFSKDGCGNCREGNECPLDP